MMVPRPPRAGEERQAPFDTVGIMLSKYQRRLKLHTLIAAGLLACVTVFSAVKFSEQQVSRSPASPIVGAVFLSIIILAGGILAWGRGAVEWQADLLLRHLSKDEGGAIPEPGAGLRPNMSIQDAARKIEGITAGWPPGAHWKHYFTLVLTILAGLSLFAYAWLPVFLPAPKSAVAAVHQEVIGLPLVVQFDVDRAEVSGEMRGQLENLARRVARIAELQLLVEGYTDSDYVSAYNLQLSRLRAEAVRKILVGGGVDPQRITVVGYGETRPATVERSAAGKAQNRRVEVTLIRQGATYLRGEVSKEEEKLKR